MNSPLWCPPMGPLCLWQCFLQWWSKTWSSYTHTHLVTWERFFQLQNFIIIVWYLYMYQRFQFEFIYYVLEAKVHSNIYVYPHFIPTNQPKRYIDVFVFSSRNHFEFCIKCGQSLPQLGGKMWYWQIPLCWKSGKSKTGRKNIFI